MKKKIFFIIGEHRSLLGINSFLEIIKKNFENEYDIIISKKFKPKSINILVENFTNTDVEQIKKFKNQSSFKIILVVTEFFNNKLNTFNSFEANNLINLKYKYFFNKFIFFLLKLNSFVRNEIKNFLIKYFNFNIIKYRKFKIFFYKGLIKNIDKGEAQTIFSKYAEYYYFKKRYENFMKVLDYADIILASHPDILRTYKSKFKKTFYIMPILNCYKSDKTKNFSNYFKFSGELTSYRRKFFKKNLDSLKKHDLKDYEKIKIFLNKILKYKGNKFIDISNKKKFKFSLHPKKNTSWNYSSPIRYVDAINKGEIPLIFDKFNDFFSRNLAIYINFKSSKSLKKLTKKYYKKNIQNINNGILKYNIYIKNNNKLILRELNKLFINIK
jgi:hypothetical protein